MKKLAILIASSAILALAAAGCGKAGTAANQPADSAKEAAVGQSAGTSAEAAAEQSAGTSAETAAEQPAGKTGMQIASAWLINGDDETRTYVTIDLSGGWSVEFAPGAFYLYENMQSKEDESSAMGITLSEEVYDEYADEAEESSGYEEEARESAADEQCVGTEEDYREAVGQSKEQGEIFGDGVFCDFGFGFCLHAGSVLYKLPAEGV